MNVQCSNIEWLRVSKSQRPYTHIRHNIETSDRLVINNINYLITKQYSAGET